MIHALLKGRSPRPRFTVEPNGQRGFAVSDNRLGQLHSGPFPSRGEAAYECDRARQPHYHTGAARPAWTDLDELCRSTWQRNATPRTWPESI